MGVFLDLEFLHIAAAESYAVANLIAIYLTLR